MCAAIKIPKGEYELYVSTVLVWMFYTVVVFYIIGLSTLLRWQWGSYKWPHLTYTKRPLLYNYVKMLSYIVHWELVLSLST